MRGLRNEVTLLVVACSLVLLAGCGLPIADDDSAATPTPETPDDDASETPPTEDDDGDEDEPPTEDDDATDDDGPPPDDDRSDEGTGETGDEADDDSGTDDGAGTDEDGDGTTAEDDGGPIDGGADEGDDDDSGVGDGEDAGVDGGDGDAPDDGDAGDGADDGERQIDSCTVIDEPGGYELTEDVTAETDEEADVCIHVEASDVVLDGDAHAVEGVDADESVGILIYDPRDGSQDELENVTVRDLEATNWGTGIDAGNFEDVPTIDLDLEDVEVSDNSGNGIQASSVEPTFEDVTANDNGGSGIMLWEPSTVTFDGITVSRNDGDGLYLWDLVRNSEFADVTATDNGGAGIDGGTDVGANTFTDLYLANNAEAGFDHADDTGGNTIEDSVIEDNDGPGILVHRETSGETYGNVTLRGNGGLALDADRDGVEIDATEFSIGNDATFEFATESVGLDPVERDDLPGTSDDASSVGDGVDVTGAEAVDATFEYNTDEVDGEEVNLGRHDGELWHVGSTHDADGPLRATLSADGVYAPVDSGDDDDGIDECTTIDEAGEYELIDDVEADGEEVCIRIVASDVELDGGGHTVEGTGGDGSVGVGVFESDDDRVEDVEISDFSVESWGVGVQIATRESSLVGDVRVADAVVQGNDVGVSAEGRDHREFDSVTVANNEGSGISLMDIDDVEMRDVTVVDNGGSGIRGNDVPGVTIEDSTVSDNDGDGFSLSSPASLEATDVEVTDNGGDGIDLGTEGFGELDDVYVANNGGDGFTSDDGGTLTARDSEFEANGQAGIALWDTLADLEDVTVRDNDDWDLDGEGAGSVTAAGLSVGDDAVFDLEEDEIRLDGVAASDLPAGAEAVGDGVAVEDVAEAEVTFEYDADDVDGDEVELQRYDGEGWHTEASGDVDGSTTAELTTDGVYAPVDPED